MKTQPLRQLLPPGTLIGDRYRIERPVSSGGFGDVYAARHLVLESTVAIKILKVERLLARDAARHVGAFLDEARLLARLRHPHIVAVLDAGVVEASSRPWIALEWCEGRTLRDLLEGERRQRSPQEAWALLRPIAQALVHAHATGVLHRDLKPSNMVLAHEEGRLVPKLVDFGIGKLMSESSRLPDSTQSTGVPLGFSPTHAAPEQVTGSPTGVWTDIHGMGLLLFETITARDAYDREYPLESAMAEGRPSLGPSFGALDAILATALARDPGRRFSSMSDLVGALDRSMSTPSSIGSSAQLPAPYFSDSSSHGTGADLRVRAGVAMASLETSPTSGPVARDATMPRTSTPRSSLPGVIAGAGLIAAGVTGYAVWRIHPDVGRLFSRHSTSPSAPPPAHSSDVMAASAEPVPSASSSSSTPAPVATPAPSSSDFTLPAWADVHRDRRIVHDSEQQMIALATRRGFKNVTSSTTRSPAAVTITLGFDRGMTSNVVMMMSFQTHEFALQMMKDMVPKAPTFFAIDGDTCIIIDSGGPESDQCRADLADALAPRR